MSFFKADHDVVRVFGPPRQKVPHGRFSADRAPVGPVHGAGQVLPERRAHPFLGTDRRDAPQRRRRLHAPD